MSKPLSTKTKIATACKLADRDHPDYPSDLLACSTDEATTWALVIPCKDHWIPWSKVEIVPIINEELLEDPRIARHAQSLTFSVGMTGRGDLLLTYRINSTPNPESINSNFWEWVLTSNYISEPKYCWDPLFNLLDLLPPPSQYLKGCYDQPELYLLA